jgi:hypothetical protein
MRPFRGIYLHEYPYSVIDCCEEDGELVLYYPQDDTKCHMPPSEVMKLTIFPDPGSYTHVMFDKDVAPEVAWSVRDLHGIISTIIEPVLVLDIHDWMLTRWAACPSFTCSFLPFTIKPSNTACL